MLTSTCCRCRYTCCGCAC